MQQSRDKLATALADLGRWTLSIVRRAAGAQGFQILPRHRVVERTLAWLKRNRRLAKDFEATIASAESWIMMTNIKLLSRRWRALDPPMRFRVRH